MIETLEQILGTGWALLCLVCVGWTIGRYIYLKFKKPSW